MTATRPVPPPTGRKLDLQDASARAAAALEELSAQFAVWLREELDRLEAARAELHAGGAVQALRQRAHDLKGLGGTYDYPLITRLAGSLGRLLDRPGAPDLRLADAHVDAILLVAHQEMHDPRHPEGLALAESLEAAAAA